MSSSKKILIIDDELSLLKIMGKFLQKMGHSSITAENGRKGISLFGDDPSSFDAVFIDYNLPELSSHEIVKELRSLNSEIKVILSTGFAVDDISKEFDQIGINGTLQKPFAFNDFKQIIEQL
ncbi:Regulator of RpoS [Candidatus Lokiarchaeum ossiferum]|uniref:Regulator of RpoS n=1 Tax=Candidatus Lokiarchaeum ossiferum TaxID=2951803 RepID=A0ABY6HRH8_9ARCH|nr:Regulator of RpoS [Candidatus Lokiarchaeum sp. B-35]